MSVLDSLMSSKEDRIVSAVFGGGATDGTQRVYHHDDTADVNLMSQSPGVCLVWKCS